MTLIVKKITLWRGVVQNRPGALAEVLEPLAAAKADLQVVMGYREPGQPGKAAIELYPVSGRRLSEAVEGAGLTPASFPALLVRGPNHPGVAHGVARSLADAGINLVFLVAQVIGRSYSAIFGFESEADAARAAALIRKTAR
jgi:hypothetical protein